MDMVTILGCRGSVPVSGGEFSHFGGATSCVFVRLGGQAVILDAGTGLLSLPSVLEAQERELPLLLSHPHADHLLGLPMCPTALRPEYHISIWAVPRQGLGPEEQVCRLMSPPLWPVGPEMLPSQFSYHPISGSFCLGNVQVCCMEGDHPGGVTAFRLTCSEKSLVYLPDCTLLGDTLERAADFAQGCSLLICDGQYSPGQWRDCSGFGHSTWEMAAQLGDACGAERVRIFHHDPTHTDTILTCAAARLAEDHPRCTFAYEGEEIPL